jgi:hypothetical protein
LRVPDPFVSPFAKSVAQSLGSIFSRLAAQHLKLRVESAREGATGDTRNATRKTKYQTSRPPQKAAQTCQGLFPHKGKAISVRERSRQSFAAIYLSRPTYAQARLPHAVDSAPRNNGITYNQLIHGLKVAGVDLDRKILADMAVLDGEGFAALVATAKQHFPAPKKAPVKSAA